MQHVNYYKIPIKDMYMYSRKKFGISKTALLVDLQLSLPERTEFLKSISFPSKIMSMSKQLYLFWFSFPTTSLVTRQHIVSSSSLLNCSQSANDLGSTTSVQGAEHSKGKKEKIRKTKASFRIL